MPDLYSLGNPSDTINQTNQTNQTNQAGGVNWGTVGSSTLAGAGLGAFGGPIGMGIGAGVGALASIYRTKKDSQANEAQTSAATKAAADQAAAAAATLQFQRQQAEALYSQQNTTNQANYGQYAAGAERKNAVADMLGLPHTNVPAFVPMLDPGFTNPANSYPVVPPTPVPSNPGTFGQRSNPSNPSAPRGYSVDQLATQLASERGGEAIQNQLNQQPAFGNLNDPKTWMDLVYNPGQLRIWVKQGLGPKASDQLIDYYVGQIQKQPGANPTEQAGSANYWMQHLQSDPNITGQGASTVGTQPAYNVPKPASVAMMLAQSPSPYTAPAQPIPFVRPMSVGQYLR